MNATHSEATGQSGDKRGNDSDCDHNDDEQGSAGEQGRCGSRQDRVDYGDECVEKNHLGC